MRRSARACACAWKRWVADVRCVAALALAVTAACSSAPTGPEPAPLPQISAALEVRTLWASSVGEADRFVFGPAFAQGAIYAASRDGTLLRLDATSGKVQWTTLAGTPLSAGVGTDGSTVAVANEEGEVFAFNAADGKPLWKARVSSEVLAAPAVGEGLVLVRSIDNRVYAFGAGDGKRRWVYQRPAASLIIRTPSGVTIRGENAFAGFSGGKLVAIALANGGQRWEATVAAPKGATELERVTDVVGDPDAQGAEVCAAAYQGRVACYEAATGRQLWARDVSSLTGVSLDTRYAFVADEGGAVQAFDRTNGRSVWKQDKLAHRSLSLPVPVADVVAVADLEGYVHFLARETGAFVARQATDGSAVRAAPVALQVGKTPFVLVQTLDGGLHALAL